MALKKSSLNKASAMLSVTSDVINFMTSSVLTGPSLID